MKTHFLIKLTFLVIPLILGACSRGDSDDDANMLPLSGLKFSAYPNDLAVNDSAAEYLKTGLLITVHPQGSYTISFDTSAAYEAPELQLYRLSFPNDSTYSYRQVRKLQATEVDGRWVYSFVCEENDRAYWAATLRGGDNYYKGPVNHFKFTGDGAYGDNLSLNLIVVGTYDGTSDNVSVDTLALEILARFRKELSPAGISVDTMYVRYASNHPTLGASYPANKPWLAGSSSDDVLLTELGGWPENGVYDALDMILVHRIETEGVLGYSPLFGGSLGGGDGSTVVFGTHYLSGGEDVSQTAADIIFTMVHETGHFFGLRHTTSTSADMQSAGDFSNTTDGLDDTPSCLSLLQKSVKVDVGVFSDTKMIMPRLVIAGFVDNCADASNPMFPSVTNVASTGFTPEQYNIIKKTLELYPH
jgi:hypothetical protein